MTYSFVFSVFQLSWKISRLDVKMFLNRKSFKTNLKLSKTKLYMSKILQKITLPIQLTTSVKHVV